MPLPKSVQRQVDAAEATLAAQAANPSPAAIDDPAQLVSAPPPAPEFQPVAPPAPVPAPTPQPPAENWEQKFKAMQGRVPALQSENVALTSRVNELAQVVSSLKAAQVEAPKTATKVDPKDEQQFGDDMVEMVNRYVQQVYDAVRQEFGPFVRKLDERMSAVEERLTGVTAKTEQTREETFYATLDERVPTWQQINSMPKWLEWLGAKDPVYGLPRQAALDSAFERLDAVRVVAIFQQFQESLPKAPEVPSLEAQVVPASGGRGQAPATTAVAKQVLTQKFVHNFYRDVTRGRYTPEETQRIENEINLAASEGRIV